MTLNELITNKLNEITDRDQKIAAINSIREAIHSVSPFKNEPVDWWCKGLGMQQPLSEAYGKYLDIKKLKKQRNENAIEASTSND